MHGNVHVVTAVVEDAAPGRNVRWKAQAQEGQGALGDDGCGHVDGGRHNHRAQTVGQDVAHDLARGGGAERARGLDKLLLAQAEELGSHQACHGHPAKATDDRHNQDEDARLQSKQRLQRLTKQENQQQQQRQLRQAQKQVGDPHQHVVDPTARDASDGANQDPHRDRHEHGCHAHGQRDAPAVQHAGQQVTAQVIGAHQVCGRRIDQPRLEVDIVDADLVEQRPQQHRQHQRAEQPQAEIRHAMALEAPPGLGPGRDAQAAGAVVRPARGRLAPGGRHDRRQLMRPIGRKFAGRASHRASLLPG